jgi:hypothetical protein
MMYEDVIRDFARRTRRNLGEVERLLADGHEVYKVTQLINSMLGLLVSPREEYVNRIPETPIRDLEQDGWLIPRVKDGFPQVPHLKDPVRYLRNAIAHFNIEFIDDGKNQIRILRVWNKYRSRKTWEAEMGLYDLRGIAERFTDLLLAENPQ